MNSIFVTLKEDDGDTLCCYQKSKGALSPLRFCPKKDQTHMSVIV